MQCKQCGTQFEGKFCPRCGAPAEEKMSVCPVCGKERSGEDRFCSECGYDFEKKSAAASASGSAAASTAALAAAPRQPAGVAVKKFFRQKQVRTAIVVVLIAAVLLAILIPTIAFFSNKFRIGVVEKINLGDSREQVLDLLGEPYNYKEGSSFFEYYSDNYRKLLEQNDSFDPDDIEDWNDFGDAFDEALELEQKLQTEEYQYISVSFDSDGGVSAVFLDAARCEQNTGKKALKSYSLLNETVYAYAETELFYTAEYTDGSYYMGKTPDSVNATEVGNLMIQWKDRYGNECSYPVTVVINPEIPSGSGWYYDKQEKVLHILSDDAYAEELPKDIIAVAFGSNVTKIGSSAFEDCISLTSITIPDNVTSIGDYAFRDCTSLMSITIPDSVIFIGAESFAQCHIESANIPASAINFIPQSNLKAVVLTSGTSICEEAFRNCDNLTSITIPNSVISIGEDAFYSCDNLTSITIPDSVTSIGNSAFYDCESLTSFYITDIAAWCAIDFGGWPANPLSYARNLYLNGELVTDLVIPDSVTSIGGRAFYGCESLTSITIPDGVTSIGDDAFSRCINIESATMPTLAIDFIPQDNLKTVVLTSGTSIGYQAFYGCDRLTNITIPDSVTSIGGEAFRGCDSLTSITIPDGVTSIGISAFSSCDSLTSIIIPDSVTSIGNGAFFGCKSLTGVYITDITAWCAIDFRDNPLQYAHNLYLNGELVTDLVIPDGVTSIGGSAFENCISLTSVTIPDGVTSIGGSAFADCTSLTSITIPDSVTSITWSAFGGCPFENATIPTSAIDSIPQGNLKTVVLTSGTSIKAYAFDDCDSLTSVTIPDGVTSIGESAFDDCDSLTSITIPDSVTSIKEDAFASCSGLTSVAIGNGVTSIGGGAFCYCRGLTSIIIPNSVKSIGNNAFSGCSGLTSVTIGSGVTSIGDGAFSGCSGLTRITIPNHVSYIGYNAFYGCFGFTSIIIPNSVKSIGAHAFQNCSNITSVTIGSGVTSIGAHAFENCTSLTSATFKDPNGWESRFRLSAADLSNTATAARYLRSTYRDYSWSRR